jgi:hypothetical protein
MLKMMFNYVNLLKYNLFMFSLNKYHLLFIYILYETLKLKLYEN